MSEREAESEAAATGHGPRWVAAGVSLLALGLRLLRLSELRGDLGPLHAGRPSADWGQLLPDAAWYDGLAHHILGTEGGAAQAGAFWLAPLQGYLLALLDGLLDGLLGPALTGTQDPVGPALAQAVLGALCAGLAALLAARLLRTESSRSAPRSVFRSVFRSVAAAVAGLAVALSPLAIDQDLSLAGRELPPLLLVATALALTGAWRAGTRGAALRGALSGGLLLGLAISSRAALLPLAPLLVLAAAARLPPVGGRSLALLQAGALALGLALPLGATTAHNLAAGDGFDPVCTSTGLDLYLSVNPYVQSAPVDPMRLPGERVALARRARLVASRESGTWLDAAAVDRYWTGRALAAWRADPARGLGLFLRRLHESLGPRERAADGGSGSVGALLAASPLLGRLPWLHAPLAVLGLLGLLLGLRRSPAGPPREGLPFALLLLGTLGLGALFAVDAGTRLSLAPLLAAGAGAAVAWVLERLARRDGRALLVAGLGAGCLGVLLAADPLSPALPAAMLADARRQEPPACLVDPYTPGSPAIEAEYRQARARMQAGELQEARQRLSALLQADPSHLPAAVDLSALLLQAGDLHGAGRLAEAVIEADPCDDQGWANVGTAALRQGRMADGARAFQEAHRLDPYSPQYEAGLGEALLQVGNAEQGEALLQAASTWGPELWQPRAILGRRMLAAGRFDEARTLLSQALALQPDRPELRGMLGLAMLGGGDRAGAQSMLDQAKADGMGRSAPILALEKGLRLLAPPSLPTLPQNASPATP